jgi:NADPH:quinone reductase
MQTIPAQMKAAAIHRFGGPEVLKLETLPVPKPGPEEVLIHVQSAGIGVWDPYLRTGELDLGSKGGGFPRVIGNDGAGQVVAVGERVKRFRVGDTVYSYASEGGFYAEYAAVREDAVAPVPKGLDVDEAGAMGADAITALNGLEDVLQLQSGETLLVYGASGGIGHLAVQLGERLGATVIAVASGDDGVALVRRLGAGHALEGHDPHLADALRKLAPKGIDAALVLAGQGADNALAAMRKGGRVAHPNGVEPVPRGPSGVKVKAYDGEPSPAAFQRLNELIARGPFHVELGRTYGLEEAAQAHRELGSHHLGKSAFRIQH